MGVVELGGIEIFAFVRYFWFLAFLFWKFKFVAVFVLGG